MGAHSGIDSERGTVRRWIRESTRGINSSESRALRTALNSCPVLKNVALDDHNVGVPACIAEHIQRVGNQGDWGRLGRVELAQKEDKEHGGKTRDAADAGVGHGPPCSSVTAGR